MLISFEGLDNCGKTTIVGKLKKYYDGLNILTDFTREFETNIGREIKEMSKAGVLDPVLKTYLFAADRYIRTLLDQNNMNMKVVSEILGHYSEEFTNEVYVIHKPEVIIYDTSEVMNSFIESLKLDSTERTIPVYDISFIQEYLF